MRKKPPNSQPLEGSGLCSASVTDSLPKARFTCLQKQRCPGKLIDPQIKLKLKGNEVLLKLSLTCALAGLANLAAAQDVARWSVGVAATSNLNLVIAPTFFKLESSDPGYKVHVGWHANDAWRFELAYQDFGNGIYRYRPQPTDVSFVALPRPLSVKQRGVTTRAAYVWMLGKAQPYAALGVGSVRLESRSSGSNLRISNTDTGLIAEVGLEWKFDSTWSLRTGYEYIGVFSKDGAAQLGLVARF